MTRKQLDAMLEQPIIFMTESDRPVHGVLMEDDETEGAYQVWTSEGEIYSFKPEEVKKYNLPILTFVGD